MSTPAKTPASLVLFPETLPDGNGGFTIRPRPPRSLIIRQEKGRWIQEVGTVDACRIISSNRSAIHYLINADPEARRRIRWRYTGTKRGKRMFEVGSLLEWVEFTQTIGKKEPLRRA